LGVGLHVEVAGRFVSIHVMPFLLAEVAPVGLPPFV
jgi:hypothetical protein